MSRYVQLPDTDDGDNGGVHINSGIPNKAFYLVATEIGGPAWEAPGHIWYEPLKASSPNTQFQDFADTTYAKADQLYGAGSAEQQAVLAAWREVGIRISGVGSRPRPPHRRRIPGRHRNEHEWEGESLADLTKQIEAMSAQLKTLAKDVAALKGKK